LKNGDIRIKIGNKDDIIKNIRLKQFNLLSKSGSIIDEHPNISGDNNYHITLRCDKFPCDCYHTHTWDYRYCCEQGECYCRFSARGKKLRERIIKMKNRGWKLLNPVCGNPMCILSDDAHFESYKRMFLENHSFKEQKIKEEKELMLKEEMMERKAQLKAQLIEQRIEMQLEIIELEKKYYINLDRKEIDTLQYEKKMMKPQPKVLVPNKKIFNSNRYKNYRKSDINKKNVDYDDDYDYYDYDYDYEDESSDECEELEQTTPQKIFVGDAVYTEYDKLKMNIIILRLDYAYWLKFKFNDLDKPIEKPLLKKSSDKAIISDHEHYHNEEEYVFENDKEIISFRTEKKLSKKGTTHTERKKYIDYRNDNKKRYRKDKQIKIYIEDDTQYFPEDDLEIEIQIETDNYFNNYQDKALKTAKLCKMFKLINY
jgi:hypothetical protein